MKEYKAKFQYRGGIVILEEFPGSQTIDCKFSVFSKIKMFFYKLFHKYKSISGV